MRSFKTKARLNAPTEERLLHVPSKRMEGADIRPHGSSDGLGKQDTSHWKSTVCSLNPEATLTQLHDTAHRTGFEGHQRGIRLQIWGPSLPKSKLHDPKFQSLWTSLPSTNSQPQDSLIFLKGHFLKTELFGANLGHAWLSFLGQFTAHLGLAPQQLRGLGYLNIALPVSYPPPDP